MEIEPPLDVLLDVDAEYRRSRRPVLHTTRGEWSFTARYSTTPLARELRRTHDWVVISFHRAHAPEGRRTVVTETRGPLEGRRVVRGRESEPVVHAA